MKAKSIIFIVIGLLTVFSCRRDKPRVQLKPANPEWMDTVRFKTELTDEQHNAVFFKRSFEEDYRLIEDTSRIALRCFWEGAFRPYVIIRLENRLERRTTDSVQTRKFKEYEEWFATYKEDVSRLNHTCPVRKNDRCYGKVQPFVYRQGVEILPVNQKPALLATLDSIGFWKMKPSYLASPHTDGSSWTLQVYYKGKYHEVATNMQQHPIKSICLRMLQLSKYPVKATDIY